MAAGSQHASEKNSWGITLGDWLAPMIAIVAVVGMLLALISVPSESIG